MTGEHLDPETTELADPLFGTAAERRDWEEWEPWKDEDWLGALGPVDELRPADFDDEERRP
jgi:hypothetical protein